jgi:hypothetical protein
MLFFAAKIRIAEFMAKDDGWGKYWSWETL